jgi:transposase InsO family protein
MSGEFEKKLDPEAERDRRSRSASGSEASGVPPVPAPREDEGTGGESVKDFDLSPVDAEDRAEGWHPGLYLPENIPLSKLGRPRGRGLKQPLRRPSITAEQRLLILDTWKRSGLSGTDFASLVGITAVTLYHWKRRFEAEGPGGLLDKPKGAAKGSRLPDLTRRTILMLKESNPDWGCQRISDMLLRGPALPASPQAVARVLKEEGYELEESPTRPHPDHPREFERAKPNQLWQTDLFTFILKRQNRRVYLVAFLDDHSRFIVGYGLHGSQSALLVIEVLRAAISSYRPPEEVLTDNGAQYVTWRGKSAFTKELEKLGIKQIVASPRHPQTLGKVERFWGSLWRECVERAVFLDLDDARRRIGLFIDHYNFQRPHQGIGGLVPADRFFGAAPEVLRTLKERVAANALDIARHGEPRSPFYLTGQVGGKGFSVHAEGERVILRKDGGQREEVDLVPPGSKDGETTPPAALQEAASPPPLCPSGTPGEITPAAEAPPPPGVSPLDGAVDDLRFLFEEDAGGGKA